MTPSYRGRLHRFFAAFALVFSAIPARAAGPTTTSGAASTSGTSTTSGASSSGSSSGSASKGAADTSGGASDPSFKFGSAAKVKTSRWLASGNFGLLVASGNSNTTTFNGGLFVSWTDASNRFTFDASGAYSRTHALVAADTNGDGKIEAAEVKSVAQSGADNCYVRPRYDRFLDDSDSVYIAPAAASDVLAGKQLTYGGQLGIARQLYATDPHELDAELGYDFTHEEYVDAANGTLNVQSLRFFGSYKLKLADDIIATTSLEVLANFTPETTPTGHINAFTDTRINWKNTLSAKVWKNISARFSFTARYDNWPAPRPDFDIPFAPGLVIPADKLDTLTEFAIVVNFL